MHILITLPARRVSDTVAGACLGTALVSVSAMAAWRLQKGT